MGQYREYGSIAFSGLNTGGLLVAILLMRRRYRDLMQSTTILHSMKWKYFKRFFSINSQLFVRSLMMLVVYEGFTILAARFGDVELAVSSVIMRLLMLFSYFVDGFAYGLKNMHADEKASFAFGHNLGYGSTGSGNMIPVYAAIRFDVELVDEPY